MSKRSFPYGRWDPVLHFNALRLVALREGGRIEEIAATENERTGESLQPTPSPLCELA